MPGHRIGAVELPGGEVLVTGFYNSEPDCRGHKSTASAIVDLATVTWRAGIDERATAEAYVRQPDSPDMVFDPSVWDALAS